LVVSFSENTSRCAYERRVFLLPAQAGIKHGKILADKNSASLITSYRRKP
jgi:hypothetical protein